MDWILALSIISGQLIKLPVSPNGGATVLDITVASLCLLGLIKLKFKLKKPPVFITGAIFFIVIALLSLVLTPLRLQPSEYLTSFFYIVRFSLYILLGWEIYSEPSLKKRVAPAFIFSGTSLALLGLLQLIFLPDLRFLTKDGWDPHYFRTVSTLLDPNFAGTLFVLTLILILQQIVLYKKQKITAVFLFSIIYLALLTTFSRSAYFAFLISFLTFAFLKKSFRLGLFFIILFFGLLLGFSIYHKSVAEPRGVDRTQSAQLRLNTWQQGGVLFQTHPLLGVGFNAYRYALKEYNLADQDFLSSRGSSTNDSSLLFVAATTGIVGLTAFLFFLSSLIWANKYNPVLIAGLVGLISQSFFVNTLFYPFNLIWIVLIATVKFVK